MFDRVRAAVRLLDTMSISKFEEGEAFPPGEDQVDRLMKAALAELLDEFEALRRWINSRKYSDCERATRKLNDLHEQYLKTHNFDEDEWERAKAEAFEFCPFENQYGKLNDLYFTITALSLSLAQKSYAEVSTALQNADADWLMKHEVLARYGWIAKEEELVLSGKTLDNPFRCALPRKSIFGPSHPDGLNLCREFYTLILFLHSLKEETGLEFFFESKEETPDFHVRNTCGERLGVEITTLQRTFETDSEEKFFNHFHQLATIHNIFLVVRRPHSWQDLESRGEEITRWLEDKITQGHSGSLRHSTTSFSIEVTRDQGSDCRISNGNPLGTDDIAISKRSLLEDISKRIREKTKDEKKPSIRPCYLVLYASRGFSPEIKRAIGIERLKAAVDSDPSTHFEETWLVGDQSAVRLRP